MLNKDSDCDCLSMEFRAMTLKKKDCKLQPIT